MAITVDIPGRGPLHIENVLFDLNGTLACDGLIAHTTRDRLTRLGDDLTLVVMSADTYGTLEQVTAGLPLRVRRVQQALGAAEKRRLLDELGADRTAAVGNGRNDVEMLKVAALGIVIVGPEGAGREALLASDLIFGQIDDALDGLLNPRRLVATLRG
jgi:soluble P-type ATPase